MLDELLKGLELGYFEAGEAFKGLADANVWKRPAGGLLSVGELAGHLAYWEAIRMACEPEEDGKRPKIGSCKIKSLLLDERFAYYTSTVDTAPSSEQLAMTAEQVHGELVRVHQESVAHLKAQSPDLKSSPPAWGSNLEEYLRYAAFHVAYHTGQMYSVRHLLGEITVDN